MNALYIGIDRPGTTSRNRRLTLQRLLPQAGWSNLDTALPFDQSSRWARSVAFRWKIGPALKAINRQVNHHLSATTGHYDLVWVDKAVFLYPSTIKRLRSRARTLIHYTPDTAFLENRSRHFFRSASSFDLLVTTKSLEISHYHRLVEPSRVFMTTQGYDPQVHYPRHEFDQKEPEIAFVGLAEPNRFKIVDRLIQSGMRVRIAGHGWDAFVNRHQNNPLLSFSGVYLAGDEYAQFLSGAQFGLGLVSKRFPEWHTTRTFEIPACGTALVTERNPETIQYFAESEAIFFSKYEELLDRIVLLQAHPTDLEKLAILGRKRVLTDGRDYPSLLRSVLASTEIEPLLDESVASSDRLPW